MRSTKDDAYEVGLIICSGTEYYRMRKVKIGKVTSGQTILNEIVYTIYTGHGKVSGKYTEAEFLVEKLKHTDLFRQYG